MAVLHAKGRLGLGEDFRHEGILGTVFTGRLLEETQVGPYRAVVPTITGTAWITGFASYVVDPRTRSPRASPSATCGDGSAEQVAARERDLADRVDRQRTTPERDPPVHRIDLDRGGRAIAREVRPRQPADTPDGHEAATRPEPSREVGGTPRRRRTSATRPPRRSRARPSRP